MTDNCTHSVTYTGYYDTESRPVRGTVPVEELVTIYVNGQTLARLTCTPMLLVELALGFLFNEGLIEGREDVAVAELSARRGCIDVWLKREIELPRLSIMTSGCSGGITFRDTPVALPRLESDLRISPRQVVNLMEQLIHKAVLYNRTGGIHTAALANGEQVLWTAEDIGRHNTLDKLAGICLREGHSAHHHVLLTTGRISSEMVGKAARMGTPVVISRTSPTSMSIQLAQMCGITLIGYTRRRSFRVYTHEERIDDGHF
ncbi:MAG: formate dehydrogenase accessory sulfurtransferase FdhD [Anaerolineae bacterium]|nr:formate dehydrogenase accessory sulfurtransferase FdhD [Anaerolineae bacterium]